MKSRSNAKPFALNGKLRYKIRSLGALYWSTVFVSLRRVFRGPLLPSWPWGFEVAIHFLRSQTVSAFDMADPKEGREYEDSLVFHSPALDQVSIEPVSSSINGHWFRTKQHSHNTSVLYLHGGGYAYYSAAHRNLISLVTLAAKSQTFALDYRLIPEHPFPAQLEDASTAYRWLLDTGVSPKKLVVAGDSAGGNLVLSLLLSLRDSKLPLPAVAVCIAPWTDVANSGESMVKNERFDWVQKRMADQWSVWLCNGADVRNPLLSPIRADLRGLPPIYIQAGGAEILHDMIKEFADRAQQQGVTVTLDVWPTMNHDFQAFGDSIPESKQALSRIGEVVQEYIYA